MMEEKLKAFAELLERQQKARLIKEGFESNIHKDNASIIPGRKYTKIDLGGCGKFMVDAEGNIFGIKAYGVIHRGHHYGTLDTIHQWDWSCYHPIKKPGLKALIKGEAMKTYRAVIETGEQKTLEVRAKSMDEARAKFGDYEGETVPNPPNMEDCDGVEIIRLWEVKNEDLK